MKIERTQGWALNDKGEALPSQSSLSGERLVPQRDSSSKVIPLFLPKICYASYLFPSNPICQSGHELYM
jgi:hypothetical protein